MPEIARSSTSADKSLKENISNIFSKSPTLIDPTSSPLKSKADGVLSGKPISRTGPKPKAKKRISSGDYSGSTRQNLAILLGDNQASNLQSSSKSKPTLSVSKESANGKGATNVIQLSTPIVANYVSNSLPTKHHNSRPKPSFYSRPASPIEENSTSKLKRSSSYSSNTSMTKYYGLVESQSKTPETIAQQLMRCDTQTITHTSSSQKRLILSESSSEDCSFRGPSMDKKTPVVVITNCRCGEIGHYLALQFARQRCKVVCIAPHLDMMDDLSGPSFDKVASNLLDPRGIDIITEHLQEKYPRIDILMIPPSIDALGPVVEIGKYSGAWRDSCNEDIAGLVYRANLLAPLCLAQKITKLLMANKMKGTVSFVGSILGDVATPWNALFSSSMAALHALADSLRLEVAPYRIKVLLLKMGYDKSMVVNNNLPTLHFPSSSAYKSVESHVFYRAVWNKEEVESRAKIFANVAVQTTLNRHLGVHYLVESILAPYKTVFSWSSRFASWMVPELESHLNFFSPETNANWPCTGWVYELGGEGIGSLHSYRNSKSRLFLDWFRWDWLGLGYVSRPSTRLISIPTDEDPRVGWCKEAAPQATALITVVQKNNSS